MGWTKTKDQLPPEDVVVETKIDDETGCRNESKHMWHNDRWFTPDMEMYIYYIPTHWRMMWA